jgi:ADP-ribose pyrophosphatase YjhB (NUDIX family)
MTEMLDVYNANRERVGVAERSVVHAFGLWHKTVHCWIVIRGGDGRAKMVFQRRVSKSGVHKADLYTTVSGHVDAGASLEVSFKREIAEEIGLECGKQIQPKWMYETIWIADMKRKDGSAFIDRVFCNVYYAEYGGALSDFKFTDGEVASVAAIDLADFIAFSKDPAGKTIAASEYDGTATRDVVLTADDFRIVADETIYSKFGVIAERIAGSL